MAFSYTVVSNLGLNSLSKLSETKPSNYRKVSKDQSRGFKTKTSNQLRTNNHRTGLYLDAMMIRRTSIPLDRSSKDASAVL